MPRTLTAPPGVPGFLFAGMAAGIKKKKGAMDLGLIVSEAPAAAAGIFTTNAVKAAPVLLDAQRLRGGVCQAVVVNSGCANACTGAPGMADAVRVTRTAARVLGIPERLVLAASTGVIGARLPVNRMLEGVGVLRGMLSPDGLGDVARSIMTTDTFPKVAATRAKGITVAGIAKGAGMIHPRMATMLSFIMTDAAVSPGVLARILDRAAGRSFHSITVDGDMSTNDTVLLLASGRRAPGAGAMAAVQGAVEEVARNLAHMIIMDGEGATKLIHLRVTGARTRAEARRVAERIALSPLVKTAFYGEDPNWGRIVAAAGSAGVIMDGNRVDVYFGRVPVVLKGMGTGAVREAQAHREMKGRELTVTVDLHRGKSQAEILTCDLSEDYIAINADYRS